MEQSKLVEHIFSDDDISWQSMIFDAVRSEAMDPWDVDISVICEKFMDMLGSFKDTSLRTPGKVVLASAILLKLKSMKFVESDMAALDRLIAYTEQEGDDGSWEEDDEVEPLVGGELVQDKEPEGPPELHPRTPQPRKRKVSVYDLVKALEKAIEVKNRRKAVQRPRQQDKVEMPNKGFDLSVVMNDVYARIVRGHEQGEGKMMFSHVADGQSREDKVYAFVPLLHLANMRKVDLHQEQHFEDFHVQLLSGEKDITGEISKELEQQ